MLKYEMRLDKLIILITSFVESFIECDAGKFGVECKSNCSSNCKHKTCNHVNGRCSYGCYPGYRGNKCDKGKHSYCFQTCYGLLDFVYIFNSFYKIWLREWSVLNLVPSAH